MAHEEREVPATTTLISCPVRESLIELNQQFGLHVTYLFSLGSETGKLILSYSLSFTSLELEIGHQSRIEVYLITTTCSNSLLFSFIFTIYLSPQLVNHILHTPHLRHHADNLRNPTINSVNKRFLCIFE